MEKEETRIIKEDYQDLMKEINKRLNKKVVVAQELGRKIQAKERDKEGRLTNHTSNVISMKNGDTLPMSVNLIKISTRRKKS